MAYSDTPGPSRIGILSLALGLVTAFFSFNLFFELLAAECISGPCSPSFEVRVLGSILAALATGGVTAWLIVVLLRRAIYGRAR